jgi:hypothetical protein
MHAVETMRAHPTFLAFERRWQLPVYFQLRWKEIVGSLEDVLSAARLEPITPKGMSPSSSFLNSSFNLLKMDHLLHLRRLLPGLQFLRAGALRFTFHSFLTDSGDCHYKFVTTERM